MDASAPADIAGKAEADYGFLRHVDLDFGFAMSVRLEIDSRQKLFVITAEGDVTKEEMDGVLDALQGAGTAGYRKLFDATLAGTSMDNHELLAIGVRIKALQDRPLGPLAFVLQKHRLTRLARVLGILATADRPLRLFETADAARQWLDTQRSVGSAVIE